MQVNDKELKALRFVFKNTNMGQTGVVMPYKRFEAFAMGAGLDMRAVGGTCASLYKKGLIAYTGKGTKADPTFTGLTDAGYTAVMQAGDAPEPVETYQPARCYAIDKLLAEAGQ